MIEKRPYHQWRRQEVRALAASYQQHTNKGLAHQFGVSESAIENILHREGLTRAFRCRFRYTDPNQLCIDWTARLSGYTFSSPHKKKGGHQPPTATDLFREQEKQYGRQAFAVLQEAKDLIIDRDIEGARLKLEQQCPLPVYELVVQKTDPPNKIRDCLYALARWVMRSIERNPNSTIVANLSTMEQYMNKKCGYC